MSGHGGAADSYYAGAGQNPANYDAERYGGQQQPQYSYNNNANVANGQEPPPAYQPPQPQAPGKEGKQNFDQVFAIPGPKYHDIWAGILFVATVAGFVAVSAIAIRGYATTRAATGGSIYDSGATFGLTTNTVICLLVCVAVAFVLSLLYICLARTATKLLIWVTGILNIALGLATAIYMLYRHYYSGGIVFLIFVIFTIFCFITWIPRIPFSVLMLQTAIDVSRRYGHVYLVSLLGGLAAAAFAVWFAVTMVAVYVRFEPGSAGSPNPACSAGSCSTAAVTGLMVFVTFAAYWMSEWLKNTIHTTIAGVYGSWYFAADESNPNQNAFPRGATRSAFRRAVTYSFGSISLGSLIVAIINLLRQLCSVARQQAASEGDILGSILFCVLGCIIGLLDWAVQFVNRYAFCHIALYGSSYFQAAKNTWTMIKDRGIDALVNQCLVGPVFGMGATFVAYATALTAYIFLRITNPAYNEGGGFTPVVVAFAFLIGLQICNVFTTPISSGIDTLFVAMGWDPHVLMSRHGRLYGDMVRVYPHVQQAIRP